MKMALLKQTLMVDQVRDCSLWLLVEGGGVFQEIENTFVRKYITVIKNQCNKGTTLDFL